MAIIDGIRDKVKKRMYEFSKHAVDKSIIRKISVKEMEQAIVGDSEIVEDYPNDKYGSSCLILGFSEKQRPIHIHCTYPERPLVKIITLYEPDAKLWIDAKVRKPE